MELSSGRLEFSAGTRVNELNFECPLDYFIWLVVVIGISLDRCEIVNSSIELNFGFDYELTVRHI